MDLVSPRASVTYFWDDNVFRLPDGATPQAYLGQSSRSDEYRIADLGFTIDKVYGQQRFTIDVDLSQYAYRTYSYLNFVAKNGDATWAWSATPDVTGHVIYNRSQSLNSFADFNALASLARNIDTNETDRIDADWRFAGQLHAGAAIYQFTETNTLPVYDFEDVRSVSFEPNLTLESLAGNTVSLYGRIARGHYTDETLNVADQVDNAFTEHQFGLRTAYAVDGQTSFFAELGEISRQNSHFADRNFRGAIGTLKWNWVFSGKTSAEVDASRSIGSYVGTTSSYVITNRLAVGPVWLPTEKTKVILQFQETMYDFRDPIVPTGSLREDRIGGVVASLEWRPLRELTLAVTANRSNRESNYPGLQFVDNLFSARAKVSF